MWPYFIFDAENRFGDFLIEFVLIVLPTSGDQTAHGLSKFLVSFEILSASRFVIDHGINGDVEFSHALT